MNTSFIDYTNKPVIPRMMTIREVANTGLLTEYTLRALVKQNKVPFVRANTRPQFARSSAFCVRCLIMLFSTVISRSILPYKFLCLKRRIRKMKDKFS